jgi:hypothetical protein
VKELLLHGDPDILQPNWIRVPDTIIRLDCTAVLHSFHFVSFCCCLLSPRFYKSNITAPTFVKRSQILYSGFTACSVLHLMELLCPLQVQDRVRLSYRITRNCCNQSRSPIKAKAISHFSLLSFLCVIAENVTRQGGVGRYCVTFAKSKSQIL